MILMPTPIISVVIPSFNHGSFLPKTVQSILSQTVQDIEVIIVDDGSTDCSAAYIKSIKDKRVRSILFEKNCGAGIATNTGIFEARAPFVAICNSDDEWLKTKLTDQLKIMNADQHLGAIFSNVQWIDANGKEKESSEIPFSNIFQQGNRSRLAWLRWLIENGNCLCHPSVLIRREVYDKCGVYNNHYRQLPDFDMWLRVVERYEIFVMQEKTIRFRLQEKNTSIPTPANSARTLNERAMILADCFNRLNIENFASTFGTRKSPGDGNFCLPLEKVLYLITKGDFNELMFRSIGLKILHAFLESAENPDQALEVYGLPHDAYHIIMGLSSPWLNRQSLGPFNDIEKSLLLEVCSQEEQEILFRGQQRTEYVHQSYAKNSDDEEIRNHLNNLRKEFTRLVSSYSWTLTKPLRLAKAAITRRQSSNYLSEPLEFQDLPAPVLLNHAFQLQKAIDAIRASRSWWMTSPIRLMTGYFEKTVIKLQLMNDVPYQAELKRLL